MTTNVPQDVIELAKQAGFDVDDDGDIWGSENGSLLRFAELLRDQRQQGAEPMAIVTVGANEHGPFSYRETPYGIDHFPDGETNLYTTPPQANALVAAAYRKAAEICLAEQVDYEATHDAGDLAYNSALDHAATAIRSAIPADAEAALREVCMGVANKVNESNGGDLHCDLDAIVNSELEGKS
jgi:hypothetical protein